MPGPRSHGDKLFTLVSGDLGVHDLGEEPVCKGLGLGEDGTLGDGRPKHGNALGPGHGHRVGRRVGTRVVYPHHNKHVLKL